MFKVHITSNSQKQFIKEIFNCPIRSGKLSKNIKIAIKNEFKGLKKDFATSCSCLEFYKEDGIFIDCTKFNCIGEEKCSCCDKSDCNSLSI
jgi:hypothetical protein